jgi:hypothetical protein
MTGQTLVAAAHDAVPARYPDDQNSLSLGIHGPLSKFTVAAFSKVLPRGVLPRSFNLLLRFADRHLSARYRNV